MSGRVLVYTAIIMYLIKCRLMSLEHNMKIAVFSAQPFERPFLKAANQPYQHDLNLIEAKLTRQTVALAAGYPTISCFVNDKLNADNLKILASNGTQLISLRSAGFNHVDMVAAKELGLTVTCVPAYSPHAVAEFAVGLILMLNRKLHRAYMRVREHDFSLNGLLGFDLHKRTVGIIGTGKIGTVFAQIMHGFGCKLLALDPYPNEECRKLGVHYVSTAKLYQQSDIISLHCPLTSDTHHIINEQALAQMKTGVMLINTGRGGLIDTRAIIQNLKTSKIGYLGMDVYEEEENLFFQDLSDVIIQDDVFTRLQTFPNVIITGHQAFFTKEAITHIAETTLSNITAFEQGFGNIYKVEI